MKSLKIKFVVLLVLLLYLTCKHNNEGREEQGKTKSKFLITIEMPKNGTISANLGEKELTSEDLKSIEEDSVLTFVLQANEKHKVKFLMIDGKKYENVEDKKISVSIKVKKTFSVRGEVVAFFAITIKEKEHGKVNVLKDGLALENGELKEVIKDIQVTFRLISDEGYKPKFLKIGDEIINNDNDKSILEKQITVTKDIEVSFEMIENNLKTYTVEKNGKKIVFKMVNIPEAKNVTLGGDYNNGYKDVNNKMNKQHTASLSSFYLCDIETTQELYQAIMDENPSKFNGNSNLPATGEIQEKRPVEKVTWFEAIAFCNALTIKLLGNEHCLYYSDESKSQLYTKEDAQFRNSENKLEPKAVFSDWSRKGFRLPTDTEWEWAARGGENYNYAGSDELDNVAWHQGNSNNKTHEVAKKNPNGYGLYDMTGNVAEWCWDWMVAYTESETLEKDYKGVETGEKRVTRPSSYFYGQIYQFLLFRGNGATPSNSLPNTGFRIAQKKVS